MSTRTTSQGEPSSVPETTTDLGSLAKAGMTGKLLLSWPQPRLAVNTPDKLELMVGEISAGLKSHLMAVQDWYNISRDEALELVKQIAKDTQETLAANPAMAGGPRIPEPPPEEEGPGGGKSADEGPQRDSWNKSP